MAQTWLGSWQKRIELTVDQGDIDSLLTWFPVRVHLSTSSGRNSTDVSEVFDELTADGNRKKIAVTKADGITQLYVEIEKWDDANEVAELWVSRDGWEIAHDADTILYLYYDIAQPDNDTYVGDTNSAPAEAVWDANFVMVQHMADGASNAATYDSTTNDNDGTKKGANEPNEVAGEVGDAQDFDGGDDKITAPNLLAAGDWTFEMLLNSDIQDDVLNGIFSMNAAIECFFYGGNAGVFVNKFGALIGGSPYVYADTNIVIGSYRTIGCRVEAATGTYNFFQQGLPDGSYIDADGARFPTAPVIGARGGVQFFNGKIDEVRVSDTGRSNAWMRATHESLIDDLLAFGSEETLTQARWGFFTWA